MYFLMELMDMCQDAEDAFYSADDAKLRDRLDDLESALDWLIENRCMLIPKSLYDSLCEVEIIVMDEEDAERKVRSYKRRKIERNNRKEN